jgi:hypothetical protein
VPEVETLQDRYERLREDAVTAAGQGWRWGRALLERQGLAAWMAASCEQAPAPARDRVVGRACSALEAAACDPLVAALAAMVLACADAAERAGCRA